ncbi:MAG TPA: Stk1 family PASTA domain-containing Ser/Thr kinase [Propionibacteriaceae bacterium]|nr:Stk1 family PASTA domain-containing Ser/Thr kinase [Propionibacteriaceae bacterium]
MVEVGTLLGGRYEMGSVLGRGGMAEVRRARDIRLGREVAVKRLRLDLAGDTTFQKRFRREAQSAAGLNHHNIVAVYDTGEQIEAGTDVEVPYIVMELVVGHTLRDILRSGRKILPEKALEMTQQVLDALQYSHTAGIIHRDIKPANVMLTASGRIKVMDFGIARAVADTSASMTQTAAVIGTAQYLSPEQARGETVDNRSDIYAAGCLLYELLVGRPPFQGDSPVSVAYQHVRETPVAPSQLDPVITPEMDAITLKALAKDPWQRYQSAKEMRDDIGRLLAGQPVLAAPPVAAAVVPDPVAEAATQVVPATMIAVPSPVTATNPVIPVTDAPRRAVAYEERPRSRAGAAFVVTLALLLVVGLIGGFWRLNRPQPPAPVAKVMVPQVMSMTQQNATQTLESSNLKPEVKNVEGPDDATVGTVTNQLPIKGVEVEKGSTVVITINVGPSKGTIPAGLMGQDKDAVVKALQDLGFTKVTAVAATTEPVTAQANKVTELRPAEGATIAKTTPITVTFATGKSKVPNLAGYSQDTAITTAQAAGFAKYKVVEEESTAQAAGRVLRTNPPADTLMDRTAELTIVVAKAIPSAAPTVTVTAVPSPPTQSASLSASPSTSKSS